MAKQNHTACAASLLVAPVLLFGVASNANLAAQGRTWIVDIANGTGTDFTNLPPAISAAADGDLIFVRRGNYFGATTGKALTILGDGARFDISSTGFTVSALPAGRDFVLRGFLFDGFGTQLTVQNCAGRVLLDGLRMNPVPSSVTRGPALSISNSALVTIHDLTATGSPAVVATSSTVHITNSSLTGLSAVLSPLRFEAQPGLRVTGSRVDISNSGLAGGDGVVSGFTFAFPSPALVADNTDLRLRGSVTALRAGGGTLSASALSGNLGSLRLDPAVTLTPSGTAPRIAGTITVQTTTLPALSAFFAGLGFHVTLDLSAPPGDAAALFIGPPYDLLPLPLFGGELGIDPARLTLVHSGPTDPTGHLRLSILVPNNPALRGSSWAWQGLAGNATRGFTLSNRSCYAIP